MKKESGGIRAAKINAKAIIIGAIITVIGPIMVIFIPRIHPRLEGTKPEKSVELPENNNDIEESDKLAIQSTLPENEKYHPLSVYKHNSNVKQLLDNMVFLPDKDIQDLLDKVFNELNQSIELDNEFGETYYFYGVAYFKRGDFCIAVNDSLSAVNAYNDSLRYFDQAENLYSHLSNTYFDKGKTYTALGDIYQNTDAGKSKEYYQKAIDNFDRSLLNNFKYPENVHFAIGNIYYKVEEYQKAIDFYGNALQTSDDKHRPYKKEIFFSRSNASFTLGLINFLNGNYETSVDYYKEAISDNNENYTAHFELGKAYCYLNQWNEGIKEFDFILEHNPRNFDLKIVRASRNFAYSMIE